MNGDLLSRRRRFVERHGCIVDVERTGLCASCGERISDRNIAHGALGGRWCKGKPNRGWRYKAAVTTYEVRAASDFPHLAPVVKELNREARAKKASASRRIEPKEAP